MMMGVGMKTTRQRLAGIVAGAGLAVASAIGLSACATSGYNQLAIADQKDIHRVEVYLNGLVTLQAHFAQDGPAQQQGDGIFLYAPEKFEMVYDVPRSLHAVALNGKLVLRDSETGSVTHISLKRNPLGLLLRHPISFSKEVQVTNVARGAESLQVSLAEANNPSQGLLTLQFSDIGGKLSLVGMQGVDARRHHFGLSFFDVQENVPVPDGSFILPE